MPKLYMKEINKEEDVQDVMTLLKDIPDKDIDHWQTDLYLRKTPQVTKNVIDKLPNYIKNTVTQFRDNIDRDIWYEIPFIFPRENKRKGEEDESVKIPVKKLMIKESLDEWDIEKIASMIEDCLYDRNFIINRRKIWGSSIDFNVSYKYDNSHDNITVYTKDFENIPEDEWFDLARTKAEEIAEMVLDNDDDFMWESINMNKSNTLPYNFRGLGEIDIPTTTKFPNGKKIWNIGNHNPYIEDGYIIVCNTRDYRVIPETLEFVYVGKDNAEALHKVAGRKEINDKNYKDFLVTEID